MPAPAGATMHRKGSAAARQSGQDFLWYLWCGKLSPLFGRSAMTTFERLYVADASTHTEVKGPLLYMV